MADQSEPMTIETSEQYAAAIARLNELGKAPATAPEQTEFFNISAAMVDYETRGHPALADRDD